MNDHTPGPWYVEQEADDTVNIRSSEDARVVTLHAAHGVAAQYEQIAEDAAFIVSACNAHDELVAALREQTDFLASLHTTYRHDGRLAARTKAHLTAARAALAKVQP